MKSILFAMAAILLWSTLAFAGMGLKAIPLFLLLGIVFCTSGIIVLFRRRAWQIPLKTLAVGVGGIFGYHLFYFRAFALAPAVEVNLINYLWPLLIVLVSPLLLRGYRLQANHIVGALLGLAGAGLVASGGKLYLEMQYLTGYLLAGAAALTWAIYSLLTKRLPPFPTESVGVFCLISGLLALGLHYLSAGSFQAAARLSWEQWIALVLVGLGPMGAAFFFWDAALKRGDPRVIGSLAYLTPLLSTLVLVFIGGQRMTGLAFAAMVLIIAGAVVGSWANKAS